MNRQPLPRPDRGGAHGPWWMPRPWWLPRLDCGEALSLGCSVFFAAFRIPIVWMVTQRDFNNKSIFLRYEKDQFLTF